MERLQGVQSAAARWVSQTRKRDWRLKSGLKKLGWLSICQKAAYMSIIMAMKVLKNEKPERLFEALTDIRDGITQRKIVNERQFLQMKLTTRKSWSWRSLRWLEKIPDTLRNQDPTKKGVKRELKKWVRDQVPVRGCRIMWGRNLEGEGAGRRGGRPRGQDGEGDGPGGQNRGEKRQVNEREQSGREQEAAGNPELRVADRSGSQEGTEDTRKNELEEENNTVMKVGKDTEAAPMPGAVLAGRTREEELKLTRMKKYMEIETRSSTGVGTRDLRRRRTRT